MSDAAAAAATLKDALASLYGYDPNAQAQANAWLNQFSSSPFVWEACVTLLDPSNPTEVVFFCSNLLLNKVKHSWGQLPNDAKVQLSSAISSKLTAFSSQFNTSSRVVTQRMVQLLATIAALMGPEAAAAFISQAFQLLETKSQEQMSIFTSLQMLALLVEEADGLDRPKRQALMAVLVGRLGDVVQMTQQLLVALGAPSGDCSLHMSCLHCLRVWLYLNPTGASCSAALTPAKFAPQYPHLYSQLFSLLICSEPSIAEKASDLLGGLLGPGPAGEDPAAELKALDDALGSLLALHSTVMQPDAETAAACVATVVAAIASRDADLVTHQSGRAVAVAQMMLQLVSRRERKVADPCCDYFLVLNTVPVAERHPQLRVEVYASLAQCLLPHLCYPPEFVNWDEEVDDDEDSFHRFREQQGADVLESVFHMLKEQYLGSLVSMLQSSTTWQSCEGALFCARAVAVPVKAAYKLRPGATPSAQPSPQSADGLRMLSSLFQDVCSTSGRTAQFLDSPYLCQTASQLIGDYAIGFGEFAEWDLDGAIRVLMKGMSQERCCLHAANAFRNLCVRAGSRLARNVAAMGELARICLAEVAPVGEAGGPVPVVRMGLEERTAVVEGLARLIATLEATQAGEASIHLVGPFLKRSQGIISIGASQGVSDVLLNQLAQELRLVASSVRFMEPKSPVPEGVPHPALKLVESAWPILQAVAESDVCRRHNDTVDALCEVYQRTLTSTKIAAKGILQMLITPAIQMFQANLHSSVLDVVASVAELFGELKSAPVVGQIQEQALVALTSACVAAFQASSSSLSSHGDLLRSLFSMADRYLIFVSRILLSSEALPPLIHWAVTTCSLREREPVLAALSFLSHVMSTAKRMADEQDLAPQLSRLDGCLQSEGPRLVLVLLLGAADTCPTAQLRSLAGCLYTVLYNSTCSSSALHWVGQALGSSQLQGSGAPGLSADLCSQFMSLCQRSPPLPRGRFDALVSDFSAVCRGQSTPDALLAYQL